MGTGFRMPPQQQQQQPQHSQQKPDLLSEAAHNLSRNSVNTTMTSTGKGDSTATSSNASHGSYKMAMENIIEDYHGGRYVYSYIFNFEPLINPNIEEHFKLSG